MSKAPTSTDFPAYELVDTSLRRAEAGVDAAEAHGSCCGLACILGEGGQSPWLAEALDGAGGNPVTLEALKEALSALARATQAALEDGDMQLQLLLPDDAEPLVERAGSLAQWCQGFSHGLFVAARIADAEAELAGENTAEILRDFAELARMGSGSDEPESEAEDAYAELVEYVRVSVQLVFEEMTPVRRRTSAAARH